MRTTLRAMMTGALLLAGSAGMAMAQQPGAPGRMGGPGMRGPGQGGPLRALFRGITLTDAQKTQLKSTQDKYSTQVQALQQATRTDRDAMRMALDKGDTAAFHAARAKVLTDGDRVTAMRAKLRDEARGMLTADQQKQFDQNVQRMKNMRGRMGARGMRGQMGAWGHGPMAMRRGRMMRGMWGGPMAMRRGMMMRGGPMMMRGGMWGGGPGMRGGPGGPGGAMPPGANRRPPAPGDSLSLNY